MLFISSSIQRGMYQIELVQFLLPLQSSLFKTEENVIENSFRYSLVLPYPEGSRKGIEIKEPCSSNLERGIFYSIHDKKRLRRNGGAEKKKRKRSSAGLSW